MNKDNLIMDKLSTGDRLIQMLQEHVGDTDENEGAVDVLKRLLEDHRQRCPLVGPPVLNDGGPDCVGWVHSQ